MSAATLRFPFPAGTKGVAPVGSWSLDQGVDISAPGGTPLLAVVPGTVTYQNVSGFSNNAPTVPILKGDNGISYYYGHAGPAGERTPGTHVNAGDVIGSVGQGIVGSSTGPHLEIGVVQPSGAYGGGSAQLKSQLAGAAPGAPGWSPGDILSGNFPGGPADHSSPSIAEQAARDTVNAVVDWAKPSALKLTLYVVFIFAGVAMFGYGLSQMLKPAGVNPVGDVLKVGRAAA